MRAARPSTSCARRVAAPSRVRRRELRRDRQLALSQFLRQRAVAAEVGGEEHGVDVAGLEQRSRRTREANVSCSPAPARSTGFAVAAVAGVPPAAWTASRWAAPAAPGRARREVARDCAVAAAVADDRDTSSTRPLLGEQRLHRVDEAPRRVDAVHTGCAAGCVDGVERARQRAGVRSRGADSGVGASDGEQHDRLSGRACCSANARPSRKSSQ